jgi:hypothetical protein
LSLQEGKTVYLLKAKKKALELGEQRIFDEKRYIP